MPVLWRFLCGHYLRVFILCVATFVAILLTTRLEDIAKFATLGPEGIYIFLFTSYQIPYILPIAFPLSAMISSILLMQGLSKTHELTALRSAGIGIRSVFAPILVTAIFLAGINFYIVSELSTDSHLSTNRLKTEMRSINPLLLAHNKHLMKMKGIYFDTLGSSRVGEYASDIVFAAPNRHQTGINLMLAKKVTASPEEFTGTKVTFLGALKKEKESGFDELVLENVEEAKTSIADFSQFVEKKAWVIHNDHLQLPFLLYKLNTEKKAFADAQQQNQPVSRLKQIQRNINRIYSELIRRFSVALAVFSFTLMGGTFGISISRTHSSKGILTVSILTAIFLIAYFAAKGIDHLIVASALIYFIPHILMIVISLWTLRGISRGIE